MIVGISSWERMLKTGLAAILATHPDEFNSYIQYYYIKQGFGNLHLFKTTYPWTYLSSQELVDCIREANENHVRDTLFLIDEADSVYNPRDYTRKEQTDNLKGLGQHAKMGNIYIYTYQRGRPEDALLGVDKMMRSLTRLDIEIDYIDRISKYIIYTVKNYMIPPPEGETVYETKHILSDIDKYYGYWNYLEPVLWSRQIEDDKEDEAISSLRVV